jgi:hypothetical protein
MMRRATAVGAIVACLASAACAASRGGDRTLSAADAARAIEGKMGRVFPRFRFIDRMPASSAPEEIPVYQVLARHGIVEPYEAPSTLHATPELHFRLTPRGRRFARSWPPYAVGDYLAPIGTYALDDVLNVQVLSSGYAMIAYRYRIRLNTIGAMLRASGAANLRYYDPLLLRTNVIARAADSASTLAEARLRTTGWTVE